MILDDRGAIPNQPAPAWGRATLDGILRKCAREHPDRVALVDDPERDSWNAVAAEELTFAELDRRVDALAGFFRMAGLQPDAIVALDAPPTSDTVIILLAALRAGLDRTSGASALDSARLHGDPLAARTQGGDRNFGLEGRVPRRTAARCGRHDTIDEACLRLRRRTSRRRDGSRRFAARRRHAPGPAARTRRRASRAHCDDYGERRADYRHPAARADASALDREWPELCAGGQAPRRRQLPPSFHAFGIDRNRRRDCAVAAHSRHPAPAPLRPPHSARCARAGHRPGRDHTSGIAFRAAPRCGNLVGGG